MRMTSTDSQQLSPIKRAFLKIEEMQARLDATERAQREPIAIVGIGCRLPGGVECTEAFWRLLHDGVDTVTDIPADRWDVEAYYDPNPGVPGKMLSKRGSFLHHVDRFDPQFFGISPREALSMDPQQRLFLEVSWEALEDAGYAPDKLLGSRTGVFMGICKTDYAQRQMKLNDPCRFDTYYASGNAYSIASGRLSYLLGLQGPSISVDTACSSSLVAVHLACQSLRNAECRMTLVGGVNLILSPEITIAYSQSSMLAADGRCKTFDAAADGFVQGEGCGVVVLKRLSDALADGDRILALIRGSALNQDGASSGLTAPSGPAQEAVIRDALANARLMPSQVVYVEAHGTGTPLGDPIEVQALGAVLGQGRSQEQPVYIGSVKTNLGHLEGAAGITGLMKVVLALQHKEIPPSLHFDKPNPYVPWDTLPVRVPTACIPWPATDGSRIAGVSSFGFSGTNAHVVLEEAPEPAMSPPDVDRPRHLFCLSAKTASAFKELIGRYDTYLAARVSERLADVCFTATAGRAHFDHRLAMVAENLQEVREQLVAFANGRRPAGMQIGQVEIADPPRIAFLFTGQGTQYAGMGRHLYETQPTFQEALDTCNELLQPYLETPLLSVIYPENETELLLHQTAYTQPALFALEYALATLWQSWGVRPSVVMGHSVGEYVAACVAGVFSLEDAIKLIAARGRLMQALPDNGMMAAVFASEQRVAAAVAPYEHAVSIAAVNGPENSVVSGARDVVRQILENLQVEGVKSKPLTVSHAFHSPLMTPMLHAFERVVSEVNLAPPRIGLVSNVTGRVEAGSFFTSAQYWCRHIREAVRFADAVITLHEQGYQHFLEVGPAPTLLSMGSRCLPEGHGVWVPSLRQGRDDWQQILGSLGTLYVHGVDVDWAGFDRDYRRRRVALPTYPFQRERYWIDEGQRVSKMTSASSNGSGPGTGHPLLGQRLYSPLMQDVLFETQMHSATQPFIPDHQVHDAVVLPATAYLEMVASAAVEAFGPGAHAVEDMDIREALILVADEAKTVQLFLSPERDEIVAFQVISFTPDERREQTSWHVHAAGKIRLAKPEYLQSDTRPARLPLEELRVQCQEEIPVNEYYQHLQTCGMQLGPTFLGIQKLWRRKGEALGQIRMLETLQPERASYRIHPAFLDACLQILGAALFDDDGSRVSDVYMPLGLETFRLYTQPGIQLWSHARVRPSESASKETHTLDFHIVDESGSPVAEVLGLQLKRVDPEMLQGASQMRLQDWFYEVKWAPKPLQGQQETTLSPDYLPANAQIIERLQPQVEPLSMDCHLGVYDALLPQLDALSLAYVWQAFQQLGWQFTPGQRFSTASLADRLGIVSQHHRLLGRLLGILEEEGILTRDDSAWEVCCLPQVEEPQALVPSLEARYAADSAELTLLKRGGQGLAEALRGTCDPLQCLFPGGSFDLVEQLYEASGAANFYNGLACRTVAEVVESLPPDRKLRVLEIGAGTGGTTAFILQAFPPERTEYVFTDLSQLFLVRAQEKFDSYPFVRYQLLDLEQHPEPQGFAAHQFDLIIASNVVHATQDLRQTLRHIQHVLAPEGLLLLLEGTRPQRWIDLTFGLLDGWWRFTDFDVRPSYPLLPRNQWTALLADMDFTQIETTPSLVAESHALSQSTVILARGPRVPAEPQRVQTETHTTTPPAGWVIFTDQTEVGLKLSERLALQQQRCIMVTPAECYAVIDPEHYHVNPTRPEDFQRLFHDAFLTKQLPCRGVVHLWAIDDVATGEDSAKRPLETQERGSQSLLHVVQALVACAWPHVPDLWVMTRGAQPVQAEPEQLSVAHAPIWGLGRTITLEHPELHCVRVDLDPSGESNRDSQLLFDEIRSNDHEDQVAFRHNVRYVARLVRQTVTPSNAGSRFGVSERQPVQLHMATPGVLDGLALRPMTRCVPGPGEIEIRVHATGLNFRDILNALSMRDDDDPLGGECAGTVVRVGEGVQDIQIGDEIIAVTSGGFSSYLTTSTELVVKKPAGISFVEAATVPVAFLTAYYALHQVGNMVAGERVVIHAAAGGVGMAAVQLAQRAGVEIFATAGSAEKRAFLKSLGAQHVMDSRSLAFADEVMQRTGGEGVDIVLNSLSGEFIPKGLSVLREHGRFLEIGKREIWPPDQVAKVNDKARYFAIDLAEKLRNNPATLRPLFVKIVQSLQDGVDRPLPYTVFSFQETPRAFRFMAQAKHIGKIVVSQEGAPAGQAVTGKERASGTVVCKPDATYLITGGLGGLGLLVAQWMVERGVRHLVLMGRSEPSEATRKVLQRLRQQGAQIMVAQGDVSKEQQLSDILAESKQGMPPLRGVIHAAGILDDGVLLQQNWDRFVNVMAPKVDGTWNLHRLTRHMSLDFFILFSSISALLGSPAQGNHAAANAFMDTLAHHRQAFGLPALSINWGIWSDIGAAALHNVGERVAVRGMGAFTPQQGLQVLEWLFRHPTSQVGVMPVNWAAFLRQSAGNSKSTYFAELTAEVEAHVPSAAASGDILPLLEAASPAKRQRVLLAYVEEQVAKVLGLDHTQTIPPRQPLTDMGLDSLMAVELRNVLGTSLGLQRALPATLVFDYPTTTAITEYLAKELFSQEAPPSLSVEAQPDDMDSSDMLEKIEQLSDAEIDRLFSENIMRGN